MPDFKKNNRFSGGSRRPFSTGTGARPGMRPQSRDFAQKELFDAECASCHSRCQVPFRPNGKKPVYCANCFTKDEGASRPYAAKREYGTPSRAPYASASPAPNRELSDLKRQVELMNASLEKLAASFDAFTRAAALTQEVRKHSPAEEHAAHGTAAKKASAKKPAKASKAVKKAR